MIGSSAVPESPMLTAAALCSVVCVQLQVKRIMNRYFELGSPIAKYAYVSSAAHRSMQQENMSLTSSPLPCSPLTTSECFSAARLFYC